MYNIVPMEENDINEVMDLWYKNHLVNYNCKLLPNFFPGGKQTMEEYFFDRIKNNNAIILEEKKNILGYFSWISFNFHNEKSAFCPIIGHFGMEKDKEIIYTHLYNYVSREWIKNDIFNHLWMIGAKDVFLKNFSYDIGFGSYVIDACIKNGTIKETNCQYKITKAEEKDLDLLFNLVEESRQYYLEAPIFLKREVIRREKIERTIRDNIVFLAWDNADPIGFMNVGKNDEYDIEQLFTPESARACSHLEK